MLLAAPIGVQELVFAVWLLVKGFDPSSLPPAMYSDNPITAPSIDRTAAPKIAPTTR